MKKITVVYKVYSFKELSKAAREKAKKIWYENEDYPMLEDDLTEQLGELLKKNKIAETGETALSYSLSYSQGDGLNFTGRFTWKKHDISITHSWRYPFAAASDMIETDQEGNESDPPGKFRQLYLKICKELEKSGYAILDYRMDDNEFSDHCKANGYNFFIDGRMANL